KEFLGSRPLTKKRTQTDLEDDANEECSNTSEGLLEKYSKVVDELQIIKDKCSKLETENSELRRQLTEHCSKSKENSSKDKEIEAFWRFEDGREEWLPAKLIRKYANGECSVQYSDGVSRVRFSWVREVGQMYIDHDSQMTPVDFEVTRSKVKITIDNGWQMTPIDFQVTSGIFSA
ncbi:hypothetical protein DPMN_146929, partial [Dreissena polymorpha]